MENNKNKFQNTFNLRNNNPNDNNFNINNISDFQQSNNNQFMNFSVYKFIIKNNYYIFFQNYLPNNFLTSGNKFIFKILNLLIPSITFPILKSFTYDLISFFASFNLVLYFSKSELNL